MENLSFFFVALCCYFLLPGIIVGIVFLCIAVRRNKNRKGSEQYERREQQGTEQHAEQIEKIALLARDYILKKQAQVHLAVPRHIMVNSHTIAIDYEYEPSENTELCYRDYGFSDFPVKYFSSKENCHGIFINELARRLNKLLGESYTVVPRITHSTNGYSCYYWLVNKCDAFGDPVPREALERYHSR